MGKVSIVFWSGTGNTAAMASMVADGVTAAGGEAEVLPVDAVLTSDLADVKAIAFGCPSMGAEQLEENVMEPFMEEMDGQISGKAVGLFGSYGWGNGEWMQDWEARVQADGANLVNGEGVICNAAPDADAEEALKALGSALAQLA